MASDKPDFLGELRLGRYYVHNWQLAVFGVPGIVGIIILVGSAIFPTTGKLGWVTIFLGLIFLALNLLTSVELLAGSSERGGSYFLVQETLGNLPALLTGWGLLAGLGALAGGLFQLASELAARSLNLEIVNSATWLAGLSCLLLVLLNMVHWPEGANRRLISAGAALFLFTVYLGGIIAFNGSNTVFTHPEFSTLIGAAALWAVAFAIFEMLLAARRQVEKPARLLPTGLGVNLAIWGMLGLAFLIIIALPLQASSSTTGKAIALLVTSSSTLPDWVQVLILAFLLLMGGNVVLRSLMRHAGRLTEAGLFPKPLLWNPRWASLPPGLVLLSGLFLIPMIFQSNSLMNLQISAWCFLLVMSMVNIGEMVSRYREPKRRRTLVLPFHPLVPVLGTTINFILVNTLPLPIWMAGIGWLALGGLTYLLYARHTQVDAMLGEVLFRKSPRDKTKKGYRILVPIGQQRQRKLTLQLAVSLANQVGGEVIPLQVITVPDPLAIEEGRQTAKERNQLFAWSVSLAEKSGVPVYPITRLSRSVPEGIIDTANEEECDLVLIAWDGKSRETGRAKGRILESVARGVQCDIAVVSVPKRKEAQEGEQFKSSEINSDDGSVKMDRVMVLTAGGPNAPLATRLAMLLTRDHSGTVEAVYIAPLNPSPTDLKEGQERIDQTIKALRNQEAQLETMALEDQDISLIKTPIEGKVFMAAGITQGIIDAGKDCDLLFIGATEESVVDQFLFGNIPENVAAESEVPVIIVKRYRGLPRFWLQRFLSTLLSALPTISRDRQMEVTRNLSIGARPNIDYFVLIGLSTLIAAFGLLQNSAAVIIGAMLVAPLFTPLMSLGLAIATGNFRMLRQGFESALKGVLLAIGLAMLLTAITPLKPLTSEIAARTTPNVFDLGVALAAGIVGAYAVARKEVAAALPGVAIAAALVPPLAVVGIGLATARLNIAVGATLLVSANLIAIAFSGAITFILLGFRPLQKRGNSDLRQGLTYALVFFALISIPLILTFTQTIRSSQLITQVHQTTLNVLADYPEIQMTHSTPEGAITIEATPTQLLVTIPVYVHGTQPANLVTDLDSALTEATGQDIHLRLVTLHMLESP